MDENSKINLTIENYTGEKPIVVVYREGLAGKVLDEKAPVSTDGEVFLQLVSPGAKEISDEWRDTAIDRVLNEIRGIAPDIAILEA